MTNPFGGDAHNHLNSIDGSNSHKLGNELKQCETRDSLVAEFCNITGTTFSSGMDFILNSNQNLQDAINDFFGNLPSATDDDLLLMDENDLVPKEKMNHMSDCTNDNFIVIPDDSTSIPCNSIILDNSDESVIIHENISFQNCNRSIEDKLLVLSWNVDGIMEEYCQERAVGVSHCINGYCPDVVMLQEVTDEILVVLQAICKNYTFRVEKVAYYFCIIMFRKHKDIAVQHSATKTCFENSCMGRFILSQEALIRGKQYIFMTSHLESLREHSKVRCKQLETVFDFMLDKQDSSVVMAGDLNIRENELSSIGGVPRRLKDAWVECGSLYETKYTWDLMRNDNLVINGKPRARYDRMYIKQSDFKPEALNFKLIGTERLKSCGMFPSDHFGILCTFNHVA